LENKLIAIVRVRGTYGVRQEIKETMKRMNLNRVNSMIILYGNKSNIGMINKCSDFVTYGEIDSDTIELIAKKRNLKMEKSDIESVSTGKKSPKEVIKMPIRMHPPRKGYRGIKQSFKAGGDLGYRGKEINSLIKRMA
ncbi:MAG: uL30 family ribosomal protein, partial [Candidatus Marsarchaeota archaeon]|nr:uL30 family ribosomal protein [Candidatus Marsarchaeota archaeon]